MKSEALKMDQLWNFGSEHLENMEGNFCIIDLESTGGQNRPVG